MSALCCRYLSDDGEALADENFLHVSTADSSPDDYFSAQSGSVSILFGISPPRYFYDNHH